LASFTPASFGRLGTERTPFTPIQLSDCWIERGKQRFAISKVLL
jgi:hypothetical protein